MEQIKFTVSLYLFVQSTLEPYKNSTHGVELRYDTAILHFTFLSVPNHLSHDFWRKLLSFVVDAGYLFAVLLLFIPYQLVE